MKKVFHLGRGKIWKKKNKKHFIELNSTSNILEGTPFSFRETNSEKALESHNNHFSSNISKPAQRSEWCMHSYGEGKLCSKWFNIFSKGFFLCVCSVIALLLPTPFSLSYGTKTMITAPKKPHHTQESTQIVICLLTRDTAK